MTFDSHLHDRRPSDELLARFLSGEATPVERAWVERWVSGDPARARMLRAMEDVWELPAQSLTRWETGALQARFHERLTRERRPATPLFARAARGRSFAWAAAAGLAFVAGLAFWVAPRASAPPPSVAAAADSSHFNTRRGQRATITLTDGSAVTLGADSRLSLVPGFGKGERTVVLRGEAYFEIVHDPARPFTVHTASSVTRVVGTAFGVREHDGDTSASIAVVRGRVAIGSREPSALVGAGEVGSVVAGEAPTVRRDPHAVAALTGWKDGWLTLVDATMEDAAITLSRWYDIDVHVPQSQLLRRRISVSFEDESPGAALRAIADAVDARVDWNGRSATFHTR